MAAALPFVTAGASVAGGAASLAQANRQQAPSVLPVSGSQGPGIPKAEISYPTAQPQRLPGSGFQISGSPQLSPPASPNNDLLQILAQLSQPR